MIDGRFRIERITEVVTEVHLTGARRIARLYEVDPAVLFALKQWA